MRRLAEFLSGLAAGVVLVSGVAVFAMIGPRLGLAPGNAPEASARAPGEGVRAIRRPPPSAGVEVRRLTAPRPAGFLPAPGETGEVVSASAAAGHARMLRVHIPRRAAGAPESPLLIILGADSAPGGASLSERRAAGDHAGLVAIWREVADLTGLILAAPETPLTGRPGDVDRVARLIADIAAQYPLDADRIYLFGHGKGAAQALALATRAPSLWRAVGLHALDPASAVPALRGAPAPLALYAAAPGGALPPATDMAARRLAEAGHPVTLYAISGHGGRPADLGPWLADRVWAGFRRR